MQESRIGVVGFHLSDRTVELMQNCCLTLCLILALCLVSYLKPDPELLYCSPAVA